MRSRNFLIVALLLILLLLVINIVLPSLFYGSQIIPGTDELRLFDRGKGIANGAIDIYHLWNQPQYIDTYPPGYSIIVAEIVSMFPGADAFIVSYSFRIILFSLILVLYLWLGLFLSRNIALLAVFFKGCLFVVFVNSSNHYIYLFSESAYLGGSVFTEISVLFALIFTLRYLLKKGSDRCNLTVIFLVGLFHGLTHMSGFISFTIFFSLFMVALRLIPFMLVPRYGLWTDHPLRSIERGRLMMPVFISLLLPLLIFLTYYLRILIELSSATYNIENILPIPVSLSVYLIAILLFFIIGVAGLLLRTGSEYRGIMPGIPHLSKKVWRTFMALFLIGFVVIAIAVNLDPDRFDYSGFVITVVFSSLLPIEVQTPVSILSYVAGIFLFFLSFVGLIGLMKQVRIGAYFISYFYLLCYFFFVIIFILGVIMPHRSMFFLILLPILLASSVGNLKIILIDLFSRKRPSILPSVKSISRQAAVIIITSFLVIAIVSRANMDPAIREEVESKSPFTFGSLTPPIITSELIEEVEKVHVSGEAILSTPVTQTALYAILDMEPKVPYYNPQTYFNSEYADAYFALYFIGGHAPADWLIRNNGTLVVIGYADIHGGSNGFGRTPIDIDRFEEDVDEGNLIRIYLNIDVGAIYRLNETKLK